MSIANTDLVYYASANMPEDDTTTSGGAINTAVRLVFTQLTANALVAAVSNGADTRTLNVNGRVPAGSISSEAIVLTGATEKVGTVTFERLLRVLLSATAADRTVTVRQGAGGATIATIPPNETGFRITFYKAASHPTSARTIYEKGFFRNNHATLTLNDAVVQLFADPSGKIMMGLAPSKNDSGSVANRLTAPSGVTFVDDGVNQNVPGGLLAASEHIGIWIEASLLAGDSAAKSSYTVQISGMTV